MGYCKAYCRIETDGHRRARCSCGECSCATIKYGWLLSRVMRTAIDGPEKRLQNSWKWGKNEHNRARASHPHMRPSEERKAPEPLTVVSTKSEVERRGNSRKLSFCQIYASNKNNAERSRAKQTCPRESLPAQHTARTCLLTLTMTAESIQECQALHNTPKLRDFRLDLWIFCVNL